MGGGDALTVEVAIDVVGELVLGIQRKLESEGGLSPVLAALRIGCPNAKAMEDMMLSYRKRVSGVGALFRTVP